MYKKTITYTDYNGRELTEDFYFNMTESELVEMQLNKTGGMAEYITKITSANDIPSLAALFKKLVLKSYGEKSEDGRRFIKSEKLSEEFSQTQAYNTLYMELATDSDAAIAFMNGIIPNIKGKEEAIAQAKKEAGATLKVLE